MNKYDTKKEIAEHCKKRNKYEAEARKVIPQWKEQFYSDKDWTITFTNNEWDNTDFYINNTPCELKERWVSDMNQYEKYKREGFVLTKSKIDSNECFFYHIPLTNELLYITKNKIQKGIEANDIKTITINVNKYNFAPNLGKKPLDMLLIPYDYWTKYELK